MGALGHRPLLPAGVVIGVLFAVLKGFSPSCSANRAGLIVYRLCRTGRCGLEVLRVRSLCCEAVRRWFAVLEGLSSCRAADCA